MKPDHFHKNLEVLYRSNRRQAKEIARVAPVLESRLYCTAPVAREGVNVFLPTPEGVNQPIYPTENVEEEIEQWVASLPVRQDRNHAWLLFGFGLGRYPLRLLDELPPNGMLAIIEPDALLFMTAFYSLDLSRILSDARVHLYIGQKPEKAVESVGRELQWSRFLSLPYHLLTHPYMARFRPDFPREFMTHWRNALRREQMYRRARAEHGSMVVMNTLANVEVIRQCPGVGALFNRFENVPALLAAAGPSLEKILPALQEYRQRFLIACVNTAYPVLRRHGIEPQIVFAMDHEERNVRSFESTPPGKQTFLVADPRVHPQIMRYFYPRIFVAHWRSTLETTGEPAPPDRIPVPQKSGNSLFQWLQTLVGEKGDVFGAGSVAVAGFHILARMGCRPIVLAGQDLAFTQNQAYASGTIFDDKRLPRDEQATHWVMSQEGKPLPTSETLFLYKQLLEHEIQRFGIPVYNTGSGAGIHHTITTRLENVIFEIPRIKSDIADFLQQLAGEAPPAVPAIQVTDGLRRARASLGAFIEQAKQGLALVQLESLSELPVSEKQAMLQQLEVSIREIGETHAFAFDLLNELLQTIHFEFEEHRWRFQVQEDQDAILEEKILAHVRVLDQFVVQANFLYYQLEEALEFLLPQI